MPERRDDRLDASLAEGRHEQRELTFGAADRQRRTEKEDARQRAASS
jgi:hypothetical protein